MKYFMIYIYDIYMIYLFVRGLCMISISIIIHHGLPEFPDEKRHVDPPQTTRHKVVTAGAHHRFFEFAGRDGLGRNPEMGGTPNSWMVYPMVNKHRP